MDGSALVSAFDQSVCSLSSAFTRPTFETFRQVLLGWVLTPGVGPVTGMIRTLGEEATKHWTVYEKLFYRAAWSLEDVRDLLLRDRVGPVLGDTVDFSADDTTCARRGRHVAYAGWFKDASVRARKDVIHWAHNWIVGAVHLRPEALGGARVTLPVSFALYRKPQDCSAADPFATRQQIAAGMVREVAAAFPQREIRAAADGQYATGDFLGDLPSNAWAVTRIRKDAGLHALPGSPIPGRSGRPRRKGPHLASLQRLAQRRDGWHEAELLKQGRRERRLVLGITCLWYSVCRGRPVRVVIVRDPAGVEKDDYLVATDPRVPDAVIAQRYNDRWGVEEVIEESKQSLGLERTRGWCPRTVRRQAPLALLLVTLVKLWYLQHAAAVPELRPERPPWYPAKASISFRDMLAALRRVLWTERVSGASSLTREVRKTLDSIAYALFQAA